VVNFKNNVDLNAGTRTVTVNDNSSTGTDYGILSGVLSGTGASALTKNGGGLLYVTGANTYNGNTVLDNGTLAVMSIGSGGASSNLGNAVGSLTIGNAGTNTPYLLYYGAGETVTRSVIWNSTTGSATIDSSGSGPLKIGNLTITGAGAKSLTLRGLNSDANEVSSALTATMSTGGVTKTDAGTWILSGANAYTGATTVSSGWLGLGGTTGGTANNPLPAGLTIGGNYVSAGIFATNPAGLTISSTVTIVQQQTAMFGGLNSITLNGNVTQTTGGDATITNVISGGTLTINGNWTNPETSTTTDTSRTLNIRGTGNTVWTGAINNSAARATSTAPLNISIAPDATFTISGSPTFTSASNGTTTLSQGNLILGRTTNLFGGSTTQTFSFNGGTLAATSALTGANAIANPVVIGGSPVIFQGSNGIELGNATAALAMAASRSLINNLSGATLTVGGAGVVNSAASTLSILGPGTTLFTSAYKAGTGASVLQLQGTGHPDL